MNPNLMVTKPQSGRFSRYGQFLVKKWPIWQFYAVTEEIWPVSGFEGVFWRAKSEFHGRKTQMYQPGQFCPVYGQKMSILAVLTRSQSKSDQFQVFKYVFDN